MDECTIGQKPTEACRSSTPGYRFRSVKCDQQPHEWHLTCIRLIFLRGKNCYPGLVQVAPLDSAVSEGLRMLMTRDEDIPPGRVEEYAELGQILSETIHIVTYTWSVFLNEAKVHLQLLVSLHLCFLYNMIID